MTLQHHLGMNSPSLCFPFLPMLHLKLPFTLYLLDLHVFAAFPPIQKQGAHVKHMQKGCQKNNIKHLYSCYYSSLGNSKSALKLNLLSPIVHCHTKT